MRGHNRGASLVGKLPVFGNIWEMADFRHGGRWTARRLLIAVPAGMGTALLPNAAAEDARIGKLKEQWPTDTE
ncbi:MAG: hypothetical protein AMXMBFR13_33690 [Phycisphaerae bacterium]